MATATATSLGRIESLLGEEARTLLEHRCETVSREMLHLPGPDFVDRVLTPSDRNVRVLRSLQALFDVEVCDGIPQLEKQGTKQGRYAKGNRKRRSNVILG